MLYGKAEGNNHSALFAHGGFVRFLLTVTEFCAGITGTFFEKEKIFVGICLYFSDDLCIMN